MRGSTGGDVRQVNYRYERHERVKKLQIACERVSAALADAERLAYACGGSAFVSHVNNVQDANKSLRQHIEEFLRTPE